MLVEWRDDNGAPQRAVLPRKIALQGASDIDLSEAIPYGTDFAASAAVKEFGQRLTAALHDSEIWTWQDFIDKPNEARAAVLRAGYQALRQEAMR